MSLITITTDSFSLVGDGKIKNFSLSFDRPPFPSNLPAIRVAKVEFATPPVDKASISFIGRACTIVFDKPPVGNVDLRLVVTFNS